MKRSTSVIAAILTPVCSLWLAPVGGAAAAPLPAAENLLLGADFDAYEDATPAPWECRYGHKGGNFPRTRPHWICRKAVDPDAPAIGAYLSVEKEQSGAGMVVIGQRLTLPDPSRPLDLAVHYQAFCANDNRSGSVALHIYSTTLWDSLPQTPEQALAAAPPGDLFYQEIKSQGDDVTSWTLGRASPAALRKALQQHAGREVVVGVSFATWHESAEEWARFDSLWLGDPLPFIQALGWPRVIYPDEPISLTVEASWRGAAIRPLLRYRPAGSDAPWQAVPMSPSGPGLYAGTIPGEAVRTALEAYPLLHGSSAPELTGDKTLMRLGKRPQHPNLFYNMAELQRMREKIDHFDWARRVYEGVKTRADNWLTREFAPQVISGSWWHHYSCSDCGGSLDMQGPRRHVCKACGKVWDTDILHGVYWSKMHGDHARAAQDLALVYQMTGENRYARRAVEILTWYADHYAEFPTADKGGKVVSQTLDECVWLLQMMNAADLAYPAMTQAEARHIERDLIYAGAMYTRRYRGGIHNIRCWHNACWAAAGYFVGDPELVEVARDHAYGFVAQMEQGVLEDGMWYERSMGYHDYTVMAILFHVKAAMHAGDPLQHMPQVRDLLLFPLKIAFPNLVVPSLNDGGFSSRPIGANRLELAAAWYGDPLALGALGKLHDLGISRANMEAWQFGEDLPRDQVFTPPPSMDLTGAGLVVLRREANGDPVCAMLEYGEHGGGHGHPDKLQLLFYGLGRQIYPDLGTVGYANPLHAGYYKTTPAHNTVTIGGRNMAPGKGELVAFESNAAATAAVARSTELYEGWTLVRRLYLGNDGILVDEFSVSGNQPDTLDWFLRSDGSLTLEMDSAPLEETPPAKPYGFLSDHRGTDTGDDWAATWNLDPQAGAAGPRIMITMAGEADTQVVHCKAPGPARSGQRWDTLRVRRTTPETRFRVVHQLLPAGATPRSVRFESGGVRLDEERLITLPSDPLALPTAR